MDPYDSPFKSPIVVPKPIPPFPTKNLNPKGQIRIFELVRQLVLANSGCPHDTWALACDLGLGFRGLGFRV